MMAAKSWSRSRYYRVTRRRLLRTGALSGAALAATALACGSKPAAQKGAGQPAASSSGQEKPQPGGKVVLAVTTDPFDWDLSYTGKTPPANTGIAYAYQSLLGFKHGPGVPYGRLTVEGELSDKWETPDAQTYTFHLRPGVKFANLAPANGRAVTSGDVKWSFEYWSRTGALKDKKLPQAQFDWFFEGLDRIETPDESTIVVRFQQPFAPFLNYAAADYNPIVPHEIFDQNGHLKDRLAGMGPWQLDTSASQKGSRWVWKKNPTFWDSGRPYIDEIDWFVIPDTSSMVSAFQAKQVDWLGEGEVIDFQRSESLKKSVPTATVHANLAVSPLHLYMNTRTGPLTDVRVRQAISRAIDRDEFIRTVDGGQGGWAMAGAFPDTFTQQEIKQILKYDLNEAKQLLAAAGFANGVELEFTYPGTQFGDKSITQYQLLQSQLKKAGINLVLKSIDPSDYSNNNKTAKFTMNARNKDLTGDVDSYLFATFHSSSKANYGGSKDQKLDDLIVAQRREVDPAKRKELVRQASRYLNETAQGLAINYGMRYEVAQPRLQNYAPQFSVLGVPGTESWLKQG